MAVAAPDCDSKNMELLSQCLAQSQAETILSGSSKIHHPKRFRGRDFEVKRAGKHALKILKSLALKQEQMRSQGSSSKKEGELLQVRGSAFSEAGYC